MSTRELLAHNLRGRVSDAQAGWLAQATSQAERGALPELLDAYNGASRHLGKTPLGLVTISPAAGPDADDFPFGRWTVEDAGRLLLLLARHEGAVNPDGFGADAIACYEQGDTREQQSWLRGVALLPDAGGFLPLVIDACRTNILPLFEAVACENPYPARHFPDRNFNQMVLKAMFNSVALARIVGLSRRVNPDLARMAADYAAERRAAGRSIPPDIALAIAGAAEQRTSR